MEVNFDADAKTSLTENNITTEKENNSAKVQTEKKKENEEKTINNFNSIVKYFIFGLVVVLIVCVIVFMCYKSFKTQNNNLGALLEKARKEEAILNGRLQTLEKEKQLYMHKINQLNDALQMQSEPYTSTLPMTKTSYDAPDPNKPKEKPQLLKDKEAIKAYVNSKRTTVQDEINEKEAEEREAQNNINNTTKEEIQKQTHSERREDLEQDDDTDPKVDEIMNIIQA